MVSSGGTRGGPRQQRNGLAHTLLLVCVCLLASAPTALAIVPPKHRANTTIYTETLHTFRQRMGLPPLQYKPRLVSAELCRDLSDADCEKHDLLVRKTRRVV